MIYLVLPAYNEAKSLPILMPKIAQLFMQLNEQLKVIVCDDGSTDGTAQQLQSFSQQYPFLQVITHRINRGLGETARDLFETAAEQANDDDIIVRFDCDDTHEPEFIPCMINKVKEGYDVVIASRFQPGGGQLGVSRYRAFISSMANLFMKFFFPLSNVREYSCGFRAYNAAIIKKAIHYYGGNFIQLRGLGFTCTLEKLVKLKLLGATFAEVPFQLRYDQKQSDSKMVGSVTTLGYFTMALLYHWPWGGWRVSHKKKYKMIAHDSLAR